uniref:Uncharacterized protein n=1 Tax=Timema poppense TaxID=170557 RepID=A0A7R9D6Z4_TIMPO|nr:unnamed protein product [Timema poppensis]
MLSKFSSVLQSAVDACFLGAYDIEFQDIAALAPTSGLAPPAPLLEDFVYHWRMITKFYVNKDTTTRVVVESTNIPAHLDQLIKWVVSRQATHQPRFRHMQPDGTGRTGSSNPPNQSSKSPGM